MDNRDIAAYLRKTLPAHLRGKVYIQAKLTGEIIVTGRSAAHDLIGFMALLSGLAWECVKPDTHIILRRMMVNSDNYDVETAHAAQLIASFSCVEFDSCWIIRQGTPSAPFTYENVSQA